jgi:photosynthetic reaction center H subunit
MNAVGADGVVGGVVTDVWIDRVELVVRYFEVALSAGPSVLLSAPMTRIDTAANAVRVQSILGAQFADVPLLANPDQVTLREEDQIQAYYGGGQLYATASRLEPLL